jgi:hypothetical protein
VADWLARRPARRLVYGALAVLLAFLGIVAVIKATNEPSLSNKWTFYTPAEFTALEWSRRHNPAAVTGAGFDGRLSAALDVCCERGEEVRAFPWLTNARTYLISDVIRARGLRLAAPLPIEGDSLRVYDNGAAEIYRLRPRSPYQK